MTGLRGADNSPRPTSTWPMVGRVDELALAARAVAGSRSVVLSGEAGVGKTRLARELLDEVARDGDYVQWIAATESAGWIPFGGIARVIGSEPGADGDYAAV